MRGQTERRKESIISLSCAPDSSWAHTTRESTPPPALIPGCPGNGTYRNSQGSTKACHLPSSTAASWDSQGTSHSDGTVLYDGLLKSRTSITSTMKTQKDYIVRCGGARLKSQYVGDWGRRITIEFKASLSQKMVKTKSLAQKYTVSICCTKGWSGFWFLTFLTAESPPLGLHILTTALITNPSGEAQSFCFVFHTCLSYIINTSSGELEHTHSTPRSFLLSRLPLPWCFCF